MQFPETTNKRQSLILALLEAKRLKTCENHCDILDPVICARNWSLTRDNDKI